MITNLGINSPARQQNNESGPDRPSEVNRVVPMETVEHEPIGDENPASGTSQGAESINFSKFQPLTEKKVGKGIPNDLEGG